MTERVRSASTAGYRSPKMESDLSPRKTMLVLVIVVGCFAVLWPKVFYPMLVGSATQHIKPSPIDKTTGCCDVISETDVNTIKIMSELCGTIIKTTEDRPLSGKEIVQRCRQEVLETCGIDISVVLQEQVRLGQSVKQILDEVRSLNGSLCLKYNYGVAPWRLGVPHRITVKMAPDAPNIRQERPLHLRSELIHPAFRERGRAIPHPQPAPPTRPPPRVVEGRPGPLPGMRPTLGGAGHVVPPSKQGTSSMSVIMPIYTIGIVVFFTYTLMRIIFKKQPEGVGGSLYPPVDPDPHFRKEVFESESSRLGARLTRENISTKLGDAELDQLRQRLRETELAMERIVEQMSKVPLKAQDLVNGTLSNGDVVKSQDAEEQPTVKVLGMEMTASCEGGKKWSRPDSPVLPTSSPPPAEPVPPPQEIYLEGALPAQSHLLVADSATEQQPTTGEDPAVVLAGKMTLSVISLDSENGAEEIADKPSEVSPAHEEPIAMIDADKLKQEIEEAIQEPIIEPKQVEDVQEMMEEPEYEIEEYVLEPIIMKRFEAAPVSQIEVEDVEKKLQEDSQAALITEEKIENVVQRPLIQLESEDVPHTVEVEGLEIEVDDLIKEAIESIEQKEPINIEIQQNLNLKTNEINDDLQNLENQIENKERPTLQVVPDVIEKAQLVVEELSPKTDTSETEKPLLINNEIERITDQIKDTSLTEQKSENEKCEEILKTGDVASLEKIEAVGAETEKIEEKSKVDVEEALKPVAEGPKAVEITHSSQRAEEPKLDTEEASNASSIATEALQIVEENKQVSVEKIEETPRLDTAEIAAPVSEIVEKTEEPKLSSQIVEAPPKIEEKMEREIVEESKTTSKPEEIKQGVKSDSEDITERVEETEAPKLSSQPIEAPLKIEEKISLEVVEESKANSNAEESKRAADEEISEKVEKTEAPKLSIAAIETPLKIEEKANLEVVGESKASSNAEESKRAAASGEISEKIEKTEAPKLSSPAIGTPLKIEEKANLEVVGESKASSNAEESKRAADSEGISEKFEKTEAPKLSSQAAEALQKIEEKEKLAEEPKASNKAEDLQKAENVEGISEKAKVAEIPKSNSPVIEAPKKSEETTKSSSKLASKEEEKSKSSEPVEVLSDDDELGSDEEIVEEIEEIVYESNEEESEEEDEQSEEELDRNTNRTDSGAVPRLNGERSEDLVEDSKYTTVSGATTAENDISDEELTDNEEVDDEEEIIEVEEEIEDDDYIGDEGNDVNHVSGESEPEL